VRKSLGAIQPKTLGPTSTPAMISPTRPGWLMRSNSSAMSFAVTKITSIARGILAGPSAATERNSAGKTMD
jgi:hypothetical protein